MAKVPTIYDIGIFSLDWNNAEVLTGSDRPLNVCRQANKDGVAFVYAHKDGSSAGCTLYVFKENQTDISSALANVSNGSLPCIGCGGTFPVGGIELSIIVKKDEWWCIRTNSNPEIKCVYFVPFAYPAVQAQPGCVSYVVETGHNLDSTAFYRKYSDGYIEQWGTVPGMSQTITLPTAFTTTNYAVFLQHIDHTKQAGGHIQEITNKTTTDFTTKEWSGSTEKTAYNSNLFTDWRACGY